MKVQNSVQMHWKVQQNASNQTSHAQHCPTRVLMAWARAAVRLIRRMRQMRLNVSAGWKRGMYVQNRLDRFNVKVIQY